MPAGYACATAAEPGFPSFPAHALPILVADGAAVIARCLWLPPAGCRQGGVPTVRVKLKERAGSRGAESLGTGSMTLNTLIFLLFKVMIMPSVGADVHACVFSLQMF